MQLGYCLYKRSRNLIPENFLQFAMNPKEFVTVMFVKKKTE